MQIAILGDIHGNLPALEAVLDAIETHQVDAIWNVGDHVGYGPFPSEVCQRIARSSMISIAGNYDLKCLQAESKRKIWRKKKKPEKAEALIWAYEQLSEADRAWLSGLPEERRFEADGLRVLICHANPGSDTQPIDAETSVEQLEAYAELAHADLIVFGHSHQQVFHRIAHEDREVIFLNPGTVGRPEDGDPRAGYAILTIDAGEITIAHHRLTYDLPRTVAAVRRAAMSEAFAHCFTQARPIDHFCGADAQLAPDPQTPATMQAELAAARFLARCCDDETAHAEQVTRLAVQLFDALAAVHGYTRRERHLLRLGSLLHDIGWIRGQRRHHKTSRDLILSSCDLPLVERDRIIVALLARYHRRKPPRDDHRWFRDLIDADQQLVRGLAGILRVADSLDRTHRSRVTDLECTIDDATITIHCQTNGAIEEELTAVKRKADLLAEHFGRTVRVSS